MTEFMVIWLVHFEDLREGLHVEVVFELGLGLGGLGLDRSIQDGMMSSKKADLILGARHVGALRAELGAERRDRREEAAVAMPMPTHTGACAS